MRELVNARVTKIQIVPNVTPAFRKFLDIPEDHNAIGFISSDYEEILYLAMDEASKRSKIKAIYANSAHCGRMNPWADARGESLCMMTGPKVEDVRSGMRYARDFVENKSQYYIFDDDPKQYCYAHLIPRAGLYYQEKYGIPEGCAVAHLAASPVESTFALDKALKAGQTKIAFFYEIPTKTNHGGAILYGEEAACKSSLEAFVNAVEYCYHHPMELE